MSGGGDMNSTDNSERRLFWFGIILGLVYGSVLTSCSLTMFQ